MKNEDLSTKGKSVKKQASQTDPRIQVLRNIFRNYHAFMALYEDSLISEITAPDGTTFSLWDIKELYRIAVDTTLLPFRQRQAIELFLVLNMSEADVAVSMGIKCSNPTGMYASSGLVHLLSEIDAGNVINPWLNDKEETG